MCVCRSGRLAGEAAGSELQVWSLVGCSGGQRGQRDVVELLVQGERIQRTTLHELGS